MSTEGLAGDGSLKNEVKKLRRLLFEERDKFLVERERRLRTEAWFRKHLQQCSSKIGEVALGTNYSNVAVQTDDSFFNGSSFSSPVLRHGKESFLSELPMKPSFCFLLESSNNAMDLEDENDEEQRPSSSRSFNFNKSYDECEANSINSKSSSYSKDVKTFRPTVDGLYFIDMNGRIKNDLNVNPEAIDRKRNFVQRSVARQLRIKAASEVRQQVALEKCAVVSKLISGETKTEDALSLFREPPVSAFPKKLIRGETRARFQKTSEYRKSEDAQLDITRRKWNRLHALCFSEVRIIKNGLKTVVFECPLSEIYQSRNFFLSHVREFPKKLNEDSQASFEKIVQDLDNRLSHASLRERERNDTKAKQIPDSSDGWTNRSKRRIIFLGLGLLVFGITEYCLLFWHAKPNVGKTVSSTNAASIGRPRIGAPWCLVNDKGEPEGSEDLKGNWLLMYFGFTHCPDVCPDELEKMIRIVDKLEGSEGIKLNVVPVFISVDPERDTPSRVKEYCLEFSPKLKGYTGTPEQVAKVAKDFRVYYKAGPRMSKSSNDYIVDHSIIVYLIDPEGNFADFYGQNRDENEVLKMIKLRAKEYDARRSSTVFWLFRQ